MHINKSELLSKVLVNVLFISIFFVVFFFTYGSYIGKKIVIEQMNFLSRDIKNLFGLFGKNINKTISEKISNLKMPNLENQDIKIQNNNKEIIKKAGMFILFFIVVITGITYFNYSKYGNNSYNLVNLISENFVILIAIAIIKFVFITYFASRYVSINPSVVKLQILETLRKNEVI